MVNLLTKFIHPIRQSQSVCKFAQKNEKISFLVLLVTTLFILLTMPMTIANGFFVDILFESEIGTTIVFYLDTLLFSFHSLNFFALLLTNKKFSKEAKTFFLQIFQGNKIRPQLIHTTHGSALVNHSTSTKAKF